MENLKYPTAEFVTEYLKKVENSPLQPRVGNEENNYPAVNKAELAIKKLILIMRENNKIEDVYLKVTAINSLYSTNIYDTYKIAHHIFHIKDIDKKLEDGDLSVVNEIARGHKIPNTEKEKNFYSFATKYCSFHNPKNYPIYDGLIQNLLIEYNNSKIEDFKFCEPKINYDYLRDYEKFKETIEKFKSHFSLTKFELKEIDMFLWLYAKDRERMKLNNKQSTAVR